ncbi:YdcF family protein [Nostoc parmelioides]|uniref:YdcF family protein n=1 Tax=Nostoc parmelioides FACHB-3921 TaxID=2692909 RepID=A0ABR8BK84_9NOSO|nr:YdcF family protein [Nostoc parmelioides]MBD2254502.1 YdcF family protein [Nostoc parmelioides FACHB-3921]
MKIQKYCRLGIMSFILVILLIIPVRLAIAYHQSPQPQAILTLGAWIDREEMAAQIASLYPSLKVWVSSGTPPQLVRPIFQAAGVSDSRLYLDYRAVDTVTNFTTLISDFKQHGIQHLFLITSDFHMPRAKAIATLILGSQGIAFTPISVSSDQFKQETIVPIIRDIARSLLWIFTSHTGASFESVID